MVPASVLRLVLRVLSSPFRRHTQPNTTDGRIARIQAEAKLATTDRWLKRLGQQPNGRVDRNDE